MAARNVLHDSKIPLTKGRRAGRPTRVKGPIAENGGHPRKLTTRPASLALRSRWTDHGVHDEPIRAFTTAEIRTLGMPDWIRRAEAFLAGGAVAQLAPAADASPASPASEPLADSGSAVGATLRREGDYWTLVYARTTRRLKDMKGLHYLIHLLEHPGQELHVLDLLGRTNAAIDEPEVRGALRAAGLPLLDATAKASYRRRLAELREDLTEAERHHDDGRAEQSREEIETLTEQLAAAVGLGGRDRSTGSAAERARTTVTHRLRAVIRRIAQHHPGLGDHLATRVRTGTFCWYQPDPERPIAWAVGEDTGV